MIGDAFHSLWFLAPLAVLAISLLVVAWKRPFPLARLLVLVAPAFILVGGLWGRFAGVRARTELRVGQGSYTFQRAQDGKPYVLPGFQVRLERFEAPPRPDVRLVVTGPRADAQTLALAEGQKGKLPNGLEFEVERLIPEAIAFGLESGRLPFPPASSSDPDVLLGLLGLGKAEPVLGTFHAFGEDAAPREEPLGRFAVLFRDRLDRGLLETLRPQAPRAERLVAVHGGRTLEIPVEAGGRLEVAGAALKVVAVYPDFQVRKDASGNPVMSSRSQKPLDPWLELEMIQPGRASRRVLLSARQPEYTDRLNAPNLPEGLSLRYLREGEETQARFVVFLREEHRVALVESGAVVREDTWAMNRPFLVEKGLSVTPVGLFEGFFPASPGLSSTPGRAAVRVKLLDPLAHASERAWLRPDGRRQAFLGGRVFLECAQAPPEPRDIRSTLLVVDAQGRELARKVVSAQDPLVHEGLSFLQSPQGARDPEASAIQVVDPSGGWIAWLGCGLLLAGIVWMACLRFLGGRGAGESSAGPDAEA